MADETNKPDELNDEELEGVAHSVPAPDEYPEGQAEELAESIDEPTEVDDAVVAGLEKSEELSRGTVAEAWGAGVSAITGAIESATPDRALIHADEHGDTTYVMGRELPFPLYTVVFFALGILTIIEVAISTIISGDITIPFLLGIAVGKAGLVIYFYMHLNKDSRVFAAILALPIGIALLSVLFLFAIPQGY